MNFGKKIMFMIIVLCLGGPPSYFAKKNTPDPIEIEVIDEMRFEDVAFNQSGSLITLDPESPGAAVFQIKGEPNTALKISVNPNKIHLTNPSNNKKITVDDWTFGSPVLPKKNNKGVGTLNFLGQLTFRLGATAELPVKTPVGIYTGTASIRITYN